VGDKIRDQGKHPFLIIYIVPMVISFFFLKKKTHSSKDTLPPFNRHQIQGFNFSEATSQQEEEESDSAQNRQQQG